MIKLTYNIICDICKKECNTESYECTNYPIYEFPRPTMQYTFSFGYPTEMCNDCATPLMLAREKVIRNINKQAEQNGEEL